MWLDPGFRSLACSATLARGQQRENIDTFSSLCRSKAEILILKKKAGNVHHTTRDIRKVWRYYKRYKKSLEEPD